MTYVSLLGALPDNFYENYFIGINIILPKENKFKEVHFLPQEKYEKLPNKTFLMSGTPSMESTRSKMSKEFRDIVKDQIKHNLSSFKSFSQKIISNFILFIAFMILVSAIYSFFAINQNWFVFSDSYLQVVSIMTSTFSKVIASGSFFNHQFGANSSTEPRTKLGQTLTLDYKGLMGISSGEVYNMTVNFNSLLNKHISDKNRDIVSDIYTLNAYVGKDEKSFVTTFPNFLLKLVTQYYFETNYDEFLDSIGGVIQINLPLLLNMTEKFNATVSESMDSSFHSYQSFQFYIGIATLV